MKLGKSARSKLRARGGRSTLGPWLGYSLALAATAVVLWVKLLVESVIGHDTPFLLFFGSVMLSATLGGLGPGVVATLLSMVATAYFFVPPGYSFAIGIDGLIRVLVFGAEGLTFTVISATRRETIRSLRDSEARKGSVLESALDAIITIDHEGRIREFNPAAERTFGFTQRDVIGQQIADLIIPHDLRAAHREGLQRYLETGEGPVLDRRIEIRAVRSDGSQIPVELAITRVSLDGPPMFTGYLRDLTEREEAGQRLRDVMSHARCIVWSGEVWLEGDRTVMSGAVVDDEAARHVLPLDTASGGTYFDAWRDSRLPEDQKRMERLLTGMLGNVVSRYDQEFRCKNRDGEIQWLFEHISLHPTGQNRWRCVGVATDVTRLKSLQSELQIRVDQLAEMDERKDQFLAMLAHELRNPLNAINSAIFALSRTPASPETEERLRGIVERQVRLMAHVVGDLLDVSRIARGKLSLDVRPVDVNSLVRATVDDHMHLFTSAGVEIRTEFHTEPLMVDADSNRLVQVFLNLVQNAAKFTERGGSVTITTAEDSTKREAVVMVADSGVGIEPDIVPTLFEPFVQDDRQRNRALGGLGLGLALVRGLTELHRGTVTARSPGLGAGSTFEVRLPLARESD